MSDRRTNGKAGLSIDKLREERPSVAIKNAAKPEIVNPRRKAAREAAAPKKAAKKRAAKKTPPAKSE